MGDVSTLVPFPSVSDETEGVFDSVAVECAEDSGSGFGAAIDAKCVRLVAASHDISMVGALEDVSAGTAPSESVPTPWPQLLVSRKWGHSITDKK